MRDVGPDYPWPGNVRELEQAVKRIILTGRYEAKVKAGNETRNADQLSSGLKDFVFDAETLLSKYCTAIYRRFGTYEDVARITKLDRRTAKKYVEMRSE